MWLPLPLVNLCEFRLGVSCPSFLQSTDQLNKSSGRTSGTLGTMSEISKGSPSATSKQQSESSLFAFFAKSRENVWMSWIMFETVFIQYAHIWILDIGWYWVKSYCSLLQGHLTNSSEQNGDVPVEVVATSKESQLPQNSRIISAVASTWSIALATVCF